MREIWKPIESLKSKYYISDFGKIKTLNGKILKPFNDKDGYECIRLHIKNEPYNKKIHRLVAEAFLPNPENKPTVNHINGIKSDNRVCNLEWATQRDNNLHSMYVLGHRIKTVYQFDIYGNFIKEWQSAEIVAKEFGIKSNSITKVCLGIHKTCCGYVWSYNKEINKNKLNFKKRYRIYQYDLKGNLIKVYDGIKLAQKETGIKNISAVCRGVQKTAGGYIWRYANE